jgi:hypothetical protein
LTEDEAGTLTIYSYPTAPGLRKHSKVYYQSLREELKLEKNWEHVTQQLIVWECDFDNSEQVYKLQSKISSEWSIEYVRKMVTAVLGFEFRALC